MSRLTVWAPRVRLVTRYMADGWKFYLRKLDEKPIVTTTLSTAGLFTAGDIFAQVNFEHLCAWVAKWRNGNLGRF